MHNIVSNITRWTTLRSIGNSGPAKLTIIIPLVGYLIIFNEHVLQYFELSRQLFDGSEIDKLKAHPVQISTRLLSIYFGLCLVALASAIFAVFCPQQVKRHGSPAEYAGGDGKNLSVGEIQEIADNLDRNNPQLVRFFEFVSTLSDPSLYGAGATKYRQANEETEVEGLRVYFETLDQIMPQLRIACCSLYAAGFLILLIPSIDVFTRVFILLMRSLANLLTS